ncbi:molybdopterin molybdotransferase MoeA [Aquimarina rhabdastrellae]
MITVNKALSYITDESLYSTKEIKKEIIKANGCALASTIMSPIAMPPFRQSAMDGYAVCMHNENEYTVIGEVKAGDSHHPVLKAGEAIRIFTGAAVPDTANAVVMQERVSRKEDKLIVETILTPEMNIRPKGEQVQEGAVALKKGTKLTPASIGFLVSLGITHVPVFEKPKIGIVVTGNELVTAGEPLPYGKIYESNSLMLNSALDALGYTKSTIYNVEDDYQKTLEVLKDAIATNELVLITGGISVGDYDFVGSALKALAVEEIFYKVKQKPGKPLFFGKKKQTIIYALPGNPAAALSCFYVYVQQTLAKLSGNTTAVKESTTAIAVTTYHKKGDRAQFLKAIVNQNKVSILEGQSSAMLHTFALANALVYIPEEVEKVAIGDAVSIIRLPA